MTREILLESLKLNLRSLSLEEFAGLFITPVQAIEEFYKLCHDISAGKTISLLFNPHRLSTNSIHNGQANSIYSGIQNDSSLNGLSRLYLYNLEKNEPTPFYNAVQRGYEGIPFINEFPPFVARKIYKQYAKQDKHNSDKLKIFDPCAGWGGRMIGAASIGNVYYEACEPSTKTYEGLLKLGEWLQKLQPKFQFKINHIPYEEFQDDKKFDIALTSPPYYNTEHYSDEKTNSCNKFNTFELWIEGFYKPLILNTVERLNPDSVFIINVGDRKYPLTEYLKGICSANNLYCDRIYDYLSGNGEKKEQFYCISKKRKIPIRKSLF